MWVTIFTLHRRSANDVHAYKTLQWHAKKINAITIVDYNVFIFSLMALNISKTEAHTGFVVFFFSFFVGVYFQHLLAKVWLVHMVHTLAIVFFYFRLLLLLLRVIVNSIFNFSFSFALFLPGWCHVWMFRERKVNWKLCMCVTSAQKWRKKTYKSQRHEFRN